MKVLGAVCSLRKGSNTETLVRLSLEAAAEAGAETEMLSMAGKKIGPCDGCYGCTKTGVCLIKDDMQQWLPKFEKAEAMIFGMPVYFFTVPGQAKVLMDRLYPLYTLGKLSGKVGGVISVASSLGHTGVWQVYSNFFNASHMLSADLVVAFAREKGDVMRDRHALKAARELGSEVVALASSNFRYPEAFPRPIYRLVRDKHGIDMSPAHGRFDA